MGEMADYYMDKALDAGENPFPCTRRWGTSGWVPWEDRHSAKPKRKKNLRCEHCGKGGLNWQQVKGSKWRLHDGREVHVCTPSAKGFGEVNDA